MNVLPKLADTQPQNYKAGLKELWKDQLFLGLILAIALVLRLDFLIPKNFIIDADEAIVGLMAKHIIEGAKVPIFYYGQHYMGSLEPLLAAFSFLILGISNIALKAVPLFFSLILLPILYLIGLEIGSRRTARIISILAAIPPAPLIVWSAKARGGFIELIVIGALSLFFTCRWLKSEPSQLKLTAVIGLLLGLGWWVNNQIVFFIFPIGYAFLGRLLQQDHNYKWRLYQTLRHFLTGLLAFVIGGLPFWIYNINNSFVSFSIFNQAEGSDIYKHLTGLCHTALPIILGAKRFWTWHDSYPFSTIIVAVFYLMLLSVIICQRRREIVSFIFLRPTQQQPVELFLAFLLSTFAVFSLSSFGYLVEAPRYLLPAYIGIFVLGGYAIDLLFKRGMIIGLLSFCSILLINLSSAYLNGRAIPGEPFVFNGERVAIDHSELISWLKDNNHQWIRTNYWIGYRLAFETKEAVKFIVFQEPHNVRIPSYQEQARMNNPETLPLVLVPSQAKLVKEAFKTLGIQWLESELSTYSVIHSITPSQSDLQRIDSNVLTATASHSNALAGLALDKDLTTRWGSASPQQPEMVYKISLDPPQRLRALRYDFAEWLHDYPRGLQIQFRLSNNQAFTLLSKEQYQPVSYYLDNGAYTTFYFEPLLVKEVVLTQTGKHHFFDWSIAELELFK